MVEHLPERVQLTSSNSIAQKKLLDVKTRQQISWRVFSFSIAFNGGELEIEGNSLTAACDPALGGNCSLL